MKRTICDICQKPIHFYKYKILKKRQFRIIRQKEYDLPEKLFPDALDICPECWDSIIEEIRNRQESVNIST